jgi:hypothetical protein
MSENNNSPTSNSPRKNGDEGGNGNGNGSPRQNGVNSMFMGASPPRFATIDQFMKAASTVQDMALAHEISVNQNFKLEKLEYSSNSIEKQIHDTVHKAFWNSLKQDFEQDPVEYKHALIIIAEAKQGLLSLLLPNHVKLREQIDQVLDMELIKQQMDNGTFDHQQYSMFLVQVMSKLCAPARDPTLAHLATLKEDPVEIFK